MTDPVFQDQNFAAADFENMGHTQILPADVPNDYPAQPRWHRLWWNMVRIWEACQALFTDTQAANSDAQNAATAASGYASSAAASAAAAATFDPENFVAIDGAVMTGALAVPAGATGSEVMRASEIHAAIAAAIAELVGGAPGALDTLNELAEALGDDADFAATIATELAAINAELNTKLSDVNTDDVADDAITNAKLANMAANTIKMRSAGTTGEPQDIAIAANKFIARASSGDAAAKDISDYALGLLALTSASAMRSSLSVPDEAFGSFSPTVTGTTTAGTATYSNQQGLYLRVGNRVFCDIYVNYSAGTGTGNMLISGLPFTVASYASASVPYTQNIATGAASTYPMAIVTPGSSSITLFRPPVAGGAAAAHPYDAAGEILLSINYQV